MLEPGTWTAALSAPPIAEGSRSAIGMNRLSGDTLEIGLEDGLWPIAPYASCRLLNRLNRVYVCCGSAPRSYSQTYVYFLGRSGHCTGPEAWLLPLDK